MRWVMTALLMTVLAACATPPTPPAAPQATSAGPSNQEVQGCLTQASGRPEIYRTCMDAAYAALSRRQPSAVDCVATANGNLEAYRACAATTGSGPGGSPAERRVADSAHFQQVTNPPLLGWIECARSHALAYATASTESAEIGVKSIKGACAGTRVKWIEAVRSLNATLADSPLFLALIDNIVDEMVTRIVLETRAIFAPRPTPPPAPAARTT